MARNLKYQALSTFNRPALGGKNAPIEMLRGMKNHAVFLTLDVDLTITGAAGGTVNAEGTQRLIDSIIFRENGKVRAELSGRALAYVTSRAQKQTANISVLASAAAQANTKLHADFVIDWASIYAADPGETAFVEEDARYPTTVEVVWKSDAQGSLISGTGLAINSATLGAALLYDPNSKAMPFYLPRIRRLSSPAISGVNSAFRVMLQPDRANRMESILLHSLVDDVTSTALLTGQVTLRGDRDRFVDAVDRLVLLNEQRRFFDAPVPSLGYFELHQRTYGKLSEMLIGNQDDNLRLELAATGAGTTALFDVFVFEKESIPGYTRELPPTW